MWWGRLFSGVAYRRDKMRPCVPYERGGVLPLAGQPVPGERMFFLCNGVW